MPSTRASSPADESLLPSPFRLSPASKVAALLATLDADLENGTASQPARKPVSTNTTPSKSATNDNAPVQGSQEEEDDEEEDVVRPKGRLAARMMAKEHNSADATPVGRRNKTSKSASPEPTIGDAESSEESDTSVTSPTRKDRDHRPEPVQSSPRREVLSPGLFVSPANSRNADASNDLSDSDDLPDNLPSSKRFKALVAKKRKEMAQAEAAKQQKAAEARQARALLDEEDMGITDDEDGLRLTQQARPTRKASKKAMDDINRETQRLARNMQLAYQPKTKKKFETKDLFAKFNFRTTTPEIGSSSPARPVSSGSTAIVNIGMRDSPPTSPASPTQLTNSMPALDLSTVTELEDDEENLPSMEDALSKKSRSVQGVVETAKPQSVSISKGKGKAIDVDVGAATEKKPLQIQRVFRIHPAKIAGDKATMEFESDDDLEILVSKNSIRDAKLDKIFDNIPAKRARESRGNTVQRMLAHLGSPGKQIGRNKKPSMNLTDLQISLQQRARQQATREREERIQALKDKGVILPTSEEREKEAAEVDDLLAKARREGEEIMQREKAAEKKERKANGDDEALGDSSEDEDWEENQAQFDEDASRSGSDEDSHEASDEEGQDAMALDADEAAENPASAPMFDDEADESSGEESGIDLDIFQGPSKAAAMEDTEDEEEECAPLPLQKRRPRAQLVISDDEDEDDSERSNMDYQIGSSLPQAKSPAVPTSVLRSATKTFIPGLTVAGVAGLGLTQIFAGTMDDGQSGLFDASPTQRTQRAETGGSDKMAFLRRPASTLPDFIPTMSEDTQEIVMDSQVPASQPMESQIVENETQGIQIDFDQSQIENFDSLIDDSMSQMSEVPATQDIGFQMVTPIKGRYTQPPPSTVATVLTRLDLTPTVVAETPVIKQKGKLRQRVRVVSFSEDEEAMDSEVVDGIANAFDVLRKASKKAKLVEDNFDKKKSDAKDMVNEQAEESEDEYAGLGGASDDDSGAEDDAFAKEMIDDEVGKDADESKIAAFYADRERATDEKAVEKLYNDITKGMLRRKRGADYDLSDSDDGGEARQRKKRKEFAKMRKALLADERIGKIAENPKKQAFLKAIQDQYSDDEMGFLDDFAEPESQSEEPQQTGTEQSEIMGPPKRKPTEDVAESRPPPHLRRVKGKRPSSLLEIRDSLSSLIEDPSMESQPAREASDSDDELEIEGEESLPKNEENRDPFALRRTKGAVIDRISLKRESSSTLSTNTRLAFAHPSSAPGFKVPALLRRATTNSSVVSGSSSSSITGTERMAGGSEGNGIKKRGGKHSGVNFNARESERKAAVDRTEKRRERKRFKVLEGRSKVVGGLFGGGKFE